MSSSNREFAGPSFLPASWGPRFKSVPFVDVNVDEQSRPRELTKTNFEVGVCIAFVLDGSNHPSRENKMVP